MFSTFYCIYLDFIHSCFWCETPHIRKWSFKMKNDVDVCLLIIHYSHVGMQSMENYTCSCVAYMFYDTHVYVNISISGTLMTYGLQAYRPTYVLTLYICIYIYHHTVCYICHLHQLLYVVLDFLIAHIFRVKQPYCAVHVVIMFIAKPETLTSALLSICGMFMM